MGFLIDSMIILLPFSVGWIRSEPMEKIQNTSVFKNIQIITDFNL